MDELERLLQGISVYQDVVVAGRTVRSGVRDCEARWKAIRPHLPATGTLLDVGSNFGWFSLKWCAEGGERMAASIEADLRSAAVQRLVLASHQHERILLSTSAAGVEMVRRFAEAGQRFDAVLCLSILHWLPDHRQFLETLGKVSDRVFIEHCDPREDGAGVASLRRAIGDIGDYLRSLFGAGRVERLASWNAHRTAEFPRELWLVSAGDARHVPATPEAKLSLAACLESDVAWPPRSWWREKLDESFDEVEGRLFLTPHGIHCEPASDDESADHDDLAQIRRAVARMPEHGVTTIRRRLSRAWLALMKRLHRDNAARAEVPSHA